MRIAIIAVCATFAIGLAGCEISKPYVMEVARGDQDMSIGNRGYLAGTPPPVKDRGNLKRPFYAVDIDIPDIQVNEGSDKPSASPAAKKQSAKPQDYANIK